MDRVVKNLYGKLYMGPKRVPHYYVQFMDSEKLEYVRCSDTNVSTAQKVAFDVNFEQDERRAGYAVQNSGTQKASMSKPFGVRNFVAGVGDEHTKNYNSAMQQFDAGHACESTTPVQAQSEDDDKYDSSFIDDSTPQSLTPTSRSSSDSEPTPTKASVKPAHKRNRVVLESDDELASDSPPRKASHSTSRKLTARKSARIEADSATSSKGSTASTKNIPLIILSHNTRAVPARSNASSPEIPYAVIASSLLAYRQSQQGIAHVLSDKGQNAHSAAVMTGSPNRTTFAIYQGPDGLWYSRLGLRKFKDNIPPALRCSFCAFGYCIYGNPMQHKSPY
ncbi:hypothetical protein AAVH_03548 [Aphelenchoides avenae]|nr:hypothetical protein AAVH_03548 [Aphelenchus avenae]